MGYQLGAKQTKEGIPVIENIKDLLPLREAIENNAQHKGKDFEIIVAAVKDIRKHYGYPPPNVKTCRSGCINEFNKNLKNWFAAWDKAGKPVPKGVNASAKIKDKVAAAVKGATNNNTLVPLNDRRTTLMDMDWGDLQDLAIEELGDDKIKELKKAKNNKPLSRPEIVEAIIG